MDDLFETQNLVQMLHSVGLYPHATNMYYRVPEKMSKTQFFTLSTQLIPRFLFQNGHLGHMLHSIGLNNHGKNQTWHLYQGDRHCSRHRSPEICITTERNPDTVLDTSNQQDNWKANATIKVRYENGSWEKLLSFNLQLGNKVCTIEKERQVN